MTIVSMSKLTLYEPSATVYDKYLSGLSPKTRVVAESVLRKIARLAGQDDPRRMHWAGLTEVEVATIRRLLDNAGLAPASVKVQLSYLSGILSCAEALGEMPSARLQAIRKLILGIDETPFREGLVLSKSEIGRAIAATGDDFVGRRNLAILMLMGGLGLRRIEVTRIRWPEDFSMDEGRYKVLIRGKGARIRRLDLLNGALDAVQAYLAIRGTESGFFFFAEGRSCKNQLHVRTIDHVVAKTGRAIGVDLRTHDLRRTTATTLLEDGVDIHTVAKILGHSSVETTMRYDRRPDAVKRHAIEQSLARLDAAVDRRLAGSTQADLGELLKPDPDTEAAARAARARARLARKPQDER